MEIGSNVVFILRKSNLYIVIRDNLAFILSVYPDIDNVFLIWYSDTVLLTFIENLGKRLTKTRDGMKFYSKVLVKVVLIGPSVFNILL